MRGSEVATQDRLLANFLLQKQELLRRTGMKNLPGPKWERAKSTHGKYMEAAATLVERWNVDPDVFMEAAFAWARRLRQPDGPFPQLLGSSKYMTKALQEHLQLPYEVIVEGRTQESMIQRMEDDYAEHRTTIAKSLTAVIARGGAIEDLILMTGVGEVHLLAFVMETLDALPVPTEAEGVLRNRALAVFIPQALPLLVESKIATAWLNTRGGAYAELSDFYNKYK